MAKQVWKGSVVFGPLPPALVSCGDGETRNVLTVAWTGIVNSHPPMTYISVRPERYSYGIIDRTGEFVVNFPTSALAAAADACGVLSGRKVDKASKLGLTYEECEKVAAPAIAECPLSLECRVTEKKELGSHTMFLAEIVAVHVDERLIDSKGKLNLQQAGLISYQHGEYFATGGKRGEFGFSVKKKEKKK